MSRSTGGVEAEQAMRTKLNDEDQQIISDSVNALMGLRRKKHIQITIPSDKGDNLDGVDNDKHSGTDSIIISKDYYEKHDSSDESVKSNSDSEDSNDVYSERSQQNRQLRQQSHHRAIVEIDGDEHGAGSYQTGNNRSNVGNNGNVENTKFNEFENKVATINNERIPLNNDFSQKRPDNNSTELKSLTGNDVSGCSETTHNSSVFKESNFEKIAKDINTNAVFIRDKDSYADDHVDEKQNHERNTGVTIITNNDVFSSTGDFEKYDNRDTIVEQSTAKDCNSLNSPRTGKTSRVLCAEGLRNSLEIVPDTDDELGLPTITAVTKPDPNILGVPDISLPWKQPYLNEKEYHIKEVSK